MNIELVKYVYSELIFIRDNWIEDISDDNLRRNSNILRNLLVEGKLLEAWKEIGLTGQPYIPSPNLDYFFKYYPVNTIVYAQTGSAKVPGGIIENIAMFNIELNQKDAKLLHKLEQEGKGKQVIKLTKFIDSTCIVINGYRISRKELITFVTNKLGGTHFDQSRNFKKVKEQKYFLLDTISFKLLGKNAKFYELLSIGQLLSSAEDINNFVTECEKKI